MPESATKVMWQGKMESGYLVPIVSMQETIQTYKLEDGATISLRCVLAQVVRLEDKVNANGDPIYVMQSQIVASTASGTPPKKNI